MTIKQVPPIYTCLFKFLCEGAHSTMKILVFMENFDLKESFNT